MTTEVRYVLEERTEKALVKHLRDCKAVEGRQIKALLRAIAKAEIFTFSDGSISLKYTGPQTTQTESINSTWRSLKPRVPPKINTGKRKKNSKRSSSFAKSASEDYPKTIPPKK